MTDKRFINKWYKITFIISILFIIGTSRLQAAKQNSYEIFAFKNITVEQGRQYLIDALIGEQEGDISALPFSKTVLVTANPSELETARIIRSIVDSKEEYKIKVLSSVEISTELPACNEIANNIGTIAIGNFSNPPASDGFSRTIVDNYKNGVIIITPARMMEKIIYNIKQLQKKNAENPVSELTVAQSTKPIETEPDLTSIIEKKELNTIPALLEQNLSEDSEDIEQKQDEYLNQRITDSPAPIKQTEPETKPIETEPIETKSNLYSSNEIVDLTNIPNPDQEFLLNLTGELTLIDFLSYVGEHLQMDFMYNESELENIDVTINPNGDLKGSISVREMYYYLDSVLRFKGFVMLRDQGNLVRIVSKEEALKNDTVLREDDIGTIEMGDTVVTNFFKLENISTKIARTLFEEIVSPIQLTTIDESNTIIVTDYANRMPRIKALIKLVDKPGKPKQILYRQLLYTKAEKIAPKIQILAEQLGTVSVSITTSSLIDTLPEKPERRPTDSDSTYQARLRSWQAQVNSLTSQASKDASATQDEAVTPTVFIDADDRTNRIVMIGYEEQLKEIEQLIDTLDARQKDPRKLEFYKIQYIDAEEVLNKLVELNIISQKNKSTSNETQTRNNQSTRITADIDSTPDPIPLIRNASDNLDSDTPEAISEEPLVVLVESKNSLLVHATDEQQERIAAIIGLIDKKREEEEIPYKVYKIKNVNPDYILGILDELIQETIYNEDDKIQRVDYKQDEQILVVADSNSSKLIVKANPTNQAWISNIITDLDVRQPQVLIDVTLVQISKTDIFDYDLNLISSFPDLTNTSGLTSAILPGISTGAANLVEPLINNGGRSHYADFQSNSGLGTAFYGDRHINTLLNMMEEKNYGRVMAKPKILVYDNQEGLIENKDVTYVTKTSSIPVSSGSAGTETNLIKTDIDYAPYDAGITLTITPHISESKLLRLDIEMIRKDFGAITGDKPPDTTDTKVDTTVTVPDGKTIILGGLSKMNQTKGGTKVPLISEIPLIGQLFRTINNNDIQRNLYVFVKAEIIRPPADDELEQVDLDRISKQNREAFEKYEGQFQNYQSIPGVKPSPMEPANVLDVK